MVNTGKPSGGCKLCRSRRIKCDETKPGCLKCLRAKRPCPGYRDPFDGKIRDETQATIRKYKRTRTVIEKDQVLRERGWQKGDLLGDITNGDDIKADVDDWASRFFDRDLCTSSGSVSPSASSSSLYSGASSPSSSSGPANVFQCLFTPLTTPLEQQAACYLLADYILISDAPGGKRGHYKFVYKILSRPGGPSRCLVYAFKALSFVALSSRPGAFHLMVEAESYYAKALREVNAAIQDPVEVKNDNTLAAVLLLAFYEQLASTREHLDEYIFHIKGAAHLVKIHGPEINNTEEGSEMYSVTRNQVIALRSMAPKDEFEDYNWLLTQHCPDAFVSRVARVTIGCSEVRMKVDEALKGVKGDPINSQMVRGLLQKALDTSDKLSNLDRPQNTVWEVKKGANFFDDGERPSRLTYDFHNLYTCGIYLIIWVSHLFLTDCIFRCMAWLSWPDEWRVGEDYERIVKVAERRIADIVASMSYACTWNGFNSDYGDFAVGKASADSPPKGVAGLKIFRPAFTAMMSDYATLEQKAYLYGRLKYLADVVGIKQVNVLLMLQHETAHPSKEIERDLARMWTHEQQYLI